MAAAGGGAPEGCSVVCRRTEARAEARCGSRMASAHCQLLKATSWQTADENWEERMRVNTDWALINVDVKLLGVVGWERVLDGNRY